MASPSPANPGSANRRYADVIMKDVKSRPFVLSCRRAALRSSIDRRQRRPNRRERAQLLNQFVAMRCLSAAYYICWRHNSDGRSTASAFLRTHPSVGILVVSSLHPISVVKLTLWTAYISHSMSPLHVLASNFRNYCAHRLILFYFFVLLVFQF